MEAAPDRYSLETATHRYNMGPLSCPTGQWATGIFEVFQPGRAIGPSRIKPAVCPAPRGFLQHSAQAFIIWG